MGKFRDERSIKYWVIFSPSKNPCWWSKWLNQKYGHITIARKSVGEHWWIVLESAGGNLLTDTYPLCDINKLYSTSIIVERWSTVQEKPTSRIAHLNCVELAKLVLGIRKWNLITPFQLYKFLKEENEHGKNDEYETGTGQAGREDDGRPEKERADEA